MSSSEVAPMRSSNISQDSGAGRLVVVNINNEMEIYDALPRRWRILVDSLPILQSVAEIRLYLDQLGDLPGYALVCHEFETRFPGWRRP